MGETEAQKGQVACPDHPICDLSAERRQVPWRGVKWGIAPTVRQSPGKTDQPLSASTASLLNDFQSKCARISDGNAL